MITETTQIIIDNINTTNKTISIKKETSIERDGIEIARTEPWRKAFVPGEVEDVKELTGWTDESPEVVYLNSIWTQEVIDAYNYLITNPLE